MTSATPAPDELPDDREVMGSEAARTELAWNRSGLSLLVAGAAILKVVVGIGDDRAPVIIGGVLLAGACAWALALLEARFVSSDALAGRRSADQRKLKLVARITTVFAVGALALALLPNP
jgi:uncharacterized membrane protein YidH (DUF202 family)